jgi:uncharacterized damage-inducible protein DinB
MTPPESPAASDEGQKYQQSLTQALLRLLDQSLWANRQWVEFVYSQPAPEVRPRELLAHLMLGERIWFERIAGQQRTSPMSPLMSKDELIQGFIENTETFLQLISSRLGDLIHFRRDSGEEYHAPVEDIIHHLLTHGYHHRGQLAAHYARGGIKYPNTDHINFLIENRL